MFFYDSPTPGTFTHAVSQLFHTNQKTSNVHICLPQIQPLVLTSGLRRFLLYSTPGHVGGGNGCGGYTLNRVTTTHAG